MLHLTSNDQFLENLTSEIDRKYFSVFFLKYHGDVDYNRRLRTSGGAYSRVDGHIEVNPKMWRFGLNTIIGILKHELCHYYINQTISEPHRPHGKEFKALLQEVDGLRFVPRIKQRVTYHNFAQCQGCGKLTPLHHQLNFLKYTYTCRFCGGKVLPTEHEPVVKYE